MLLLDFLLLIMIIICIVYCLILNKRIQDLQNSRVEFARMIKELNISIIKAENNINEMSELGQVTSNAIKTSIDEAKKIMEILADSGQQATILSNKLTKLIRESDRVQMAMANSFSTNSAGNNNLYGNLGNSAYEEMRVNSQRVNSQGNDAVSDNYHNKKFNEKLSGKFSDKFTEEDLPPISEGHRDSYSRHFKDFINNIVGSKKADEGQTLDQMSYYDTLKKISVRSK